MELLRGMRVTFHTDECLDGLERQISEALDAIGQDAASTAANVAPHKTGALKNSIAHVVNGNEVQIGTNIPYAIYQELGTSKIDGKHFLQFGATAHISDYQRIFEEKLKQE